MKRITMLVLVACLVLLFTASTCFAQMYTVTDLGTLGGVNSNPSAINASGQVVGNSLTTGNAVVHAFRTAPNSTINPATDDLGTLGEMFSTAFGINASGQVVGQSWAILYPNVGGHASHAFRTAPNSAINPATDDLGTLGGLSNYSVAYSINASGQVVGDSRASVGNAQHAFRTAPNSPINPATDDLGTLGGWGSSAHAISDSGQVAGGSQYSPESLITGQGPLHAFRTAPNSAINPATDDLGTLGGSSSSATHINAFGQVVGDSLIVGDTASHAFRTAPNSPINPATDDLGTLGGLNSFANAISDYGEVVGASQTVSNAASHSFLYSNGVMHDLNNLIPASSGCGLFGVVDINNAGQIAASGDCNGQGHALRLDPIYKVFVQQPLNADGSSIFRANRGVVPVKFTLTEYDTPSCALRPATISMTRTAGGTLGAIDESAYSMAADSGSNFRIDPTACQYVYNLAASALGVGTYRVDISMNGIMIGHAVFALK